MTKKHIKRVMAMRVLEEAGYQISATKITESDAWQIMWILANRLAVIRSSSAKAEVCKGVEALRRLTHGMQAALTMAGNNNGRGGICAGDISIDCSFIDTDMCICQ